MNKDLLKAVERLRVASEDNDESDEACIDARLHEARPRKAPRPSPDELKAKLEADFLTSPTAFGPEWLNRFQR